MGIFQNTLYGNIATIILPFPTHKILSSVMHVSHDQPRSAYGAAICMPLPSGYANDKLKEDSMAIYMLDFVAIVKREY